MTKPHPRPPARSTLSRASACTASGAEISSTSVASARPWRERAGDAAARSADSSTRARPSSADTARLDRSSHALRAGTRPLRQDARSELALNAEMDPGRRGYAPIPRQRDARSAWRRCRSALRPLRRPPRLSLARSSLTASRTESVPAPEPMRTVHTVRAPAARSGRGRARESGVSAPGGRTRRGAPCRRWRQPAGPAARPREVVDVAERAAENPAARVARDDEVGANGVATSGIPEHRAVERELRVLREHPW